MRLTGTSRSSLEPGRELIGGYPGTVPGANDPAVQVCNRLSDLIQDDAEPVRRHGLVPQDAIPDRPAPRGSAGLRSVLRR